jgi:hypothetical protein
MLSKVYPLRRGQLQLHVGRNVAGLVYDRR